MVVPAVTPSLTHISGKDAAGYLLTDRVVVTGSHWAARDQCVLKLAYLGEVFVFRTKTLSQPFYPQNFHLIDYNMLVFTIIILARRLIAAIVKEVRFGLNQFCVFSYEQLLWKHVWFSFF